MIKIDKVLVATDFSEPSDAAVSYGKHFARAYGSSLHLLHVVDDISGRVTRSEGLVPDMSRLQVEVEENAQRHLDEMLSAPDRVALRAHTVVLTSSTPAQAIVSYARDEGVDLIIVGTHGRGGLANFFLGSVAQHVVRVAPCPVLTVRHPEREFVRPDALQLADATPARPPAAG